MDKKSKSSGKAIKAAILSILAVCILLSGIIINIFNDSSLNVNAQELSKNIKPNKVGTQDLTGDFIAATADFSINLLKKSVSASENSLISPTSVALALGMTANGAAGDTLKQFENLLGGTGLTVDSLNKYYHTMSAILQNGQDDKNNKISLSNSIWYRQDESLKVRPDFLQVNADYYKADAYKADFNSAETITDMNKWIKSKTDGLIDKMVDKIDSDSVMFLFNTVLFEAEWNKAYTSSDVRDGIFSLTNSSTVNADYMYSFEDYLSSPTAQGFIKPYKGSKYSFVAILPNENVSVEQYIKSLDGKSFLDFINSRSDAKASAGLPKFKYDYEVKMVDPLKSLGLTDAFDSGIANFSNMATSSYGNIYIGDVLHKAFIQVDELGTKAGAATKVEMRTESAMVENKEVILDRPFIYAIIENDTKLPLFIGTVMNPVE